MEEVKDLTAKNAEMLMKFKEFQKGAASVSLGRPTESSEAIQVAPIALQKVNESRKDYESQKDSIHQMSESDRYGHRVARRASGITASHAAEEPFQAIPLSTTISALKKASKLKGAHHLSSTMMNVNKAARFNKDTMGEGGSSQ